MENSKEVPEDESIHYSQEAPEDVRLDNTIVVEEVIVFTGKNFTGNQKSYFSTQQSLFTQPTFNDKIQSVIVREGTWRFYVNENFDTRLGELGPGKYPGLNESPLGRGSEKQISCIELL